MAHLNATSGGLAAILTPTLTRQGVLQAMRERQVYATNGPRILLQTHLGGHLMGSILEARTFNDQSAEQRTLEARVTGTGTLQKIDLIRSGEVVESQPCTAATCSTRSSRPLPTPVPTPRTS